MPAGYGSHDVERHKIGGKHHDVPIIQRQRVVGNRKPMRFVSLHHHSTFSYLDGYQLPAAHVRRAAELNMGAMAITEHGNIDSHVKFEEAASGTGVKPIFGCEIYMNVGEPWAGGDPTQRKHHLTVIAKDQEGYGNLLQLITRSWRTFYYEPTVSWDDLVELRRGLVILSGCSGSLLFCSAVGGKGIGVSEASYGRALAVGRRFRETFDNYFIEVQAFPELESTRRFNALAPRLARELGARLVATMDCHYTLLEESEVQQILHNLRPGEKRSLEEQARDWGYEVPLCPPANDNTIYRRLRGTGLSWKDAVSAIQTTADIAEGCTAILPKLPMVRFPVNGVTALGEWRRLLKEGWRFRGLHRLPAGRRDEYRKQLKVEMDLIEGKDFVDYFLLVAAGVRDIKERGIPVGPARGSAAASLAAYLLRITEVDPLRPEFEGLLRFERFISVDREDLPDIDLDFPSEARPILRDFYVKLMGSEDRVNNVGTYTQFKGKNSLDDVARVYRIPQFEVNTIKDFLIERSSGDMRASSTVLDTIEQFEAPRAVIERHPELRKADLLEGNIKGFGVHAAALVLSNQPITSVTAIAEREVPKGSGNVISCVALDKKGAERQGLVKMDFLGLNTMSMIWDCLRRLGKDIGWLYNLPLDDPEVYGLLQRNDVTGIFQFEGRAQRYVCAMIKPEKFSEIMDCGALCRPGPLHNGAAREYGEIKQGGKRPIVRHEALADILRSTQYQMVYQEQILLIARLIGDFDARGVGEIRRIIALKKGEQEFNRKREEFLRGASTLHKRTQYGAMDESVADSIWGDMITSGAYAFNAAHCAAYGLISYYTAFLKHYHPAVFYAAALSESAGNKDRTRALLRDADRHGVRVLPASIRRSEASWSPVAGKLPTIRSGFRQVDGIGERTAAQIVAERDARAGGDDAFTDWNDLTALRGIGPKTIAKIRAWLDDEDPFNAFRLDKNIAKVKEALARGELGLLPEPTHTAAELADDRYAGRAIQVAWLGTFVARNIRDIFESNRARGVELDPTQIKDPDKNEWALMTGEDETDQLLINVDRYKYPKLKEALFGMKMEQDLVLVQAVKPARSGVRKLNLKKLWVIDPR